MVETLSVVILALVMMRLRLGATEHRTLAQKLADMVIAAACGPGFALLLLKVTQLPFDDLLSQFFNTYSKTIAHGRSIMNGVVVEFRCLDTLGEIVVVMETGLAILALVRIRSKKIEVRETEAEEA